MHGLPGKLTMRAESRCQGVDLFPALGLRVGVLAGWGHCFGILTKITIPSECCFLRTRYPLSFVLSEFDTLLSDLVFEIEGVRRGRNGLLLLDRRRHNIGVGKGVLGFHSS